MRLNKQSTDQRFIGIESDRGNGAQLFRTIYLPESLSAGRLMSRARSTCISNFECMATTLSAIASASPAGLAGNQANHTDSQDVVVLEKPSLGFDLASRVNWIAG